MYELVDFGEGRRLERFGPWLLDRPCAAAERIPRAHPAAWHAADARFERTGPVRGVWTGRDDLPQRWTIAYGRLVLELKRTDSGHLGLFPEHAETWDWIAAASASARPLRLLNLFAYTGGATLAAAAAGAEVTHVDAAKNVVAWARRNAGLSGLADAPVRWIVEDAMKFVRREVKRGAHYDAVVLDPPSYGHGPHGQVWRLSKHLPWLLAHCGQLTAGRRRFVLLTCHTPDYDADRLARMLADALGSDEPGTITAGCMVLRTTSGRELPSGVAVRWEAAPSRMTPRGK